MVESVLKTLANTVIYQDDENREDIFKEIEAGAQAEADARKAAADALVSGVAAAGEAEGEGAPPITPEAPESPSAGE